MITEAETEPLKLQLAAIFNKVTAELTQHEVCRVVNLPQPTVCRMRNYQLRGISVYKMLEAIANSGYDVNITVSPSRSGPGQITTVMP
jgi:predicted XRE-type DNA-binding protein